MGNTNRRRERVAESGRSHVVSRGERNEPPAGNFLVIHEPYGKYKIIEMA